MSKANALDWSFAIDIEEGTGKGGKLKGTLVSMRGNKVRLETSGKIGESFKMLMVSDGMRMQTSGVGPGNQSQGTPKKLDETFRAMLTRTGVLLPTVFFAQVEAGHEPDIDQEYRVSEFRLGKKEKVGQREGQAVKYTLTVKAMKTPLSVTVWLDSKTHLPLKRVVTGKQDGQTMTFTEMYAATALDEKIDEKKFELRK